jgi:hypothetical protein
MASDLSVTCKTCGRRWHLEAHKLITRDTDCISCRCGEALHEWSGGVCYSATQMFDVPAITICPLLSREPITELPTGTELEVLAYSQAVGRGKDMAFCRMVRADGQTYLVLEQDLLTAMGDPR